MIQHNHFPKDWLEQQTRFLPQHIQAIFLPLCCKLWAVVAA
jgi:hypothetical protein